MNFNLILGGSDDFRDAIRTLFAELGAVPLRTLWDEAIERDIVTEEILDRVTADGGVALCRKILKEKMKNDLPFAKSTGEKDPITKAPIWKQLDLFEKEEAVYCLEKEAMGVVADIEELHLLWEYFDDRFSGIAKPAVLVAWGEKKRTG